MHTVYFKIWDPDSPARSLYVEEINQQGIVRQFDPEHFFHKLTGDHIHTNQMSDYWRSHYGLPLKHGGTPFQPTWASSSSTTTPSTIPTAAKHLATLLFGAHAADQLTSSGATSSANLPDLTHPGSTTTHNMSSDRLNSPGDPTSGTELHFLILKHPASRIRFGLFALPCVFFRKKAPFYGVCVCGTSEQM